VDHDHHQLARRQDPGLAAERTALAWSRTALAVAAVAALLLRIAERHPSPVAGLVTASIALLVALAMWAYGRRGYRPRAGARLAARDPTALRAAAFAVGSIGLAAAVSVLLAFA
jgi:uncharacterized membrane protein YidH (DUF202 family)